MLPRPGRPVPVSTYRVQLRPPAEGHPGFGFDDAARIAPYLADLGVTHLYCSPYLQAAPGSAHGYDVVDHSRLSDELGGQPAFDRMAASCRDAGLGIVLDIVPNHMAVSPPQSQNAQWWSVLREGQASPYAQWFDIDWGDDGRVLVPVLGGPLADVAGDLELHTDRVRYFEHELPIAPGTVVEGDVLATLAAQHYRLADWREAKDALNYRRFFDVTELTGVRVELPAVFEATHRLVLDQVAAGVIDGLRVDHPDGFADPAGYLDQLADATGGSWVVVEKILEPGEALPQDWQTAGTTGYDVLNDVLGLFVDPAGEQPLTALWNEITGHDASYEQVVARTKRLILSDVLPAEVNRLTDVAMRACEQDPSLWNISRAALREALVEVLASFGVYRAYLPAAGPAGPVAREQVAYAVDAATAVAPGRATEIDVVRRLVLADGPSGPAAQEFVTRFQQTCGPVMAKGVEDTAFYRYHRLISLNEVGGDPGTFGRPVEQFHTETAEVAARWPETMLCLSTHDTKRSADVRARIHLLSEIPEQWETAVSRWSEVNERHRRDGWPDRNAEYLLYQTLVGAWPLDAQRAAAFMEKAAKEAKVHTSWTDPVPDYDEALQSFVGAVLADAAFVADLDGFLAEQRLVERGRLTSLAQTTLLLTCPGVPDLYQGSEVWDHSLVDPDNRRPVDYDVRRRLLDELGTATPEQARARTDEGGPKLWLIHRLLDDRRRNPEAYGPLASYEPLGLNGPRRDHAVAFARGGERAVVVPRLVAGLAGDWAETTVVLPKGRWTSMLDGSTVVGGEVPVAELLARFPVAVLGREGS